MTLVSTCSDTSTPTPDPKPTASCSNYTEAPGNAQSLSNDNYTYLVTGSSSGTIWGTGTYTDDSPIATAAVHDGHVAVGGKAVIRLTKSAGLSSYSGSTQNGVTSNSYGSWSGSYTLSLISTCSTTPAPEPEPTPDPTPDPMIPDPTPSTTDTDGDGTVDSEDTDDDNDGMTDVWEVEHQLNPLDASDAAKDADSDSYTNLAEFTAGSDPNWDLSKPGSIPVLTPGFDSRYTVQRGLINDDTLHDLLIQDPTTGIVPAVSSFVLIQQAEGGFSLESADNHILPSASALTVANSAIRLHDLNGDGVTDMLLHELDEHVDEVGDQIIYASYDEMYVIPEGNVGLGSEVKQFFSDLSDWIDNEKHFANNASFDGFLPITLQTNDLPVETGFSAYGQFELTSVLLNSHLGKCIGLSPTLCYVITNFGFGNTIERSLFDDLLIIALKVRVAVYLDPDLRTNPPVNLNLYKFDSSDPIAVLLVASYFAPIRNSGTMDQGSIAAIAISETLEGMLNSPIFEGGLETTSGGVFPEIGDYSTYEDVVQDILKVFKYVLARITLPCSNDDADECGDRQTPFVYPPPVCTPEFNLAESYDISTTPSMPSINLAVSNLSSLPRGANISWEAQVEYMPRGTACSGGPNFNSGVVSGQGNSFSPTFGGFFGGNLTVIASCQAPNYSDGSTIKTSTIQGAVPSNATLAAAILPLSSPFESADLRRIACKESNFTHFLSNGLPLVGTGEGGGDAGLMQICFNRQAADFWNYKTNIASGRRLLLDKLPFADRWLEIQRTAAAANGSTLVITDAHRRLETIHRYNAGTGQSTNKQSKNFDGYYFWDSDTEMFEIVGLGGSPNYVSDVISRPISCTN